MEMDLKGNPGIFSQPQFMENGAIFSVLLKPKIRATQIIDSLRIFDKSVICLYLILSLLLYLLMNYFLKRKLIPNVWKIIEVGIGKMKYCSTQIPMINYIQSLLFIMNYLFIIFYCGNFQTDVVTGDNPPIIDDLNDALKYGKRPIFLDSVPYIEM